MTLQSLADSILSDGRLTRNEHQLLLRVIHTDGKITPDETTQINRIFDMIQAGDLIVE